MVSIPVDSDLDDVVSIIVDSGFSRFPVRGESIDDVKGLLLARDVIGAVSERSANPGKRFRVSEVMREALFIPGTKPVAELLKELKRRKVHMAVVLDEHGGVDGVVTLEDLLEEIVGDIFDESDIPEKDFVALPNGEVLIDAGVLVSDMNERFDLEIPEGDYDTMAGFVFTQLGRIAKPGDQIALKRSGEPAKGSEVEGTNGALQSDSTAANGAATSRGAELSAILRVEQVDGQRIESLRLCPLEAVLEQRRQANSQEK